MIIKFPPGTRVRVRTMGLSHMLRYHSEWIVADTDMYGRLYVHDGNGEHTLVHDRHVENIPSPLEQLAEQAE